MGAEVTDWQAAIASALEWWDDAGVTSLAADEPRDWLARARRPESRVEQAASPAAEPTTQHVPDDLPGFTAWRTGAGAPEAGWPGAPIFASGGATSGLMILIDCPDREDEAEGRLLAGTVGRLFDHMLAAIGQNREAVLLAPLMTKRPFGRLAPAMEETLADLARRHVALARPRRLLVLGNGASRSLLGADVVAARGRLHAINHQGASVPAVASFSPRLLLERPAAKAEAWKDLQLLMGEPEA